MALNNDLVIECDLCQTDHWEACRGCVRGQGVGRDEAGEAYTSQVTRKSEGSLSTIMHWGSNDNPRKVLSDNI